ncbi:protein-associating with the carboxyl-terminal domain of ezrin isoform X3 [Pteropus alecto]|uniref:protein-associating with the carboxyl-terminal domain of ezrin isoform X3 n=1 Tax=Pteropus alecto TaxID=9402 RepID=UPI0007689311|nr:protein-associating with the carboxyl-terminal domain of ezrin isoform X3 [Pteropus alecto]XP_024899748.1 protein-associating with the carboxyl-terminal domain of ezrin isoform X3 [Pteropus alecto]
MGAESSAVRSCALEGPPVTLPSGLAVYPAVLQDGRCASVFVYKRENEDKVNKAAKHLKTLRHPCLLRFLSCTVQADGIHLITERVQPLAVALATLSSAEVCAGIYDILLALVFLHDRGHLTHNNVCLSSVFVSEDGHWKLGGMETVCTAPQATAEFLRSLQSARDPACIPPEEMSPEFTALPESHGHARDAYSFGTLVESVLTVLSGQVSAAALASFQQTLRAALRNPVPQCRPALRTLLSHDLFSKTCWKSKEVDLEGGAEYNLILSLDSEMFLNLSSRNDFLEIVNFLKSLTLKSEEEKTEFFKFLLDRVSCLSEELIASRLVPLLLNQLVFAEPVAVKSFLPHLLGPKKAGAPRGLLSPALFQARVIPVLLRLFTVHEEHVRVVLLSHLEAYVEHFTPEQLRKVILPQVLLGLRDTSSSIVAVTLHSLAVLVSLLGPEVVVGGERTKIFKRTAPSFTKTAALSPEDSPRHVVCSQHGQRLPSLSPKGFSSGGVSTRSQQHVPQDCSAPFQTGAQFSQPIKFSINGISDVNDTSGHSGNFPSSPTTSEEWPDWSEPEDPGDRTATAQVRPPEAPDAVGSPLPDLEVSAEKSPSSLGTERDSGGGVTAAVTSGEDLKPLESSRPQRTSPAPSLEDADQTKPPQVSSQERRLKVPSELGLGEEFTIQVKKKPVQDPELDWFADMTPEIKPSAVLLVAPALRAEAVGRSEDRPPAAVLFSAKFAAAETAEAEAGGWGDEGELNWEDNSW